MGYESNNIIQNLNTIIFYLIGIIIISIFTLVTNSIIKNKERLREKFKTIYDTVFFGMILRILLESYVEMTLSATMNFTDVRIY